MTVEQLQRRLLAVEPAVREALHGLGRVFNTRIAARSVGDFMRDAKGEPRRRLPTDTGPLRIVTGRLARAVNGTPGAGGIYRSTDAPGAVVLEKGVDLNIVPYARIHELGGVAGRGVRIPARPYLRPAFEAEEEGLRGEARKRLTAVLEKMVSA